MRRKYFTQLLSTQQKLIRSHHISTARARQTARVGDTVGLHEAIARGWKLEYQSQIVRQELYAQRSDKVFGRIKPLPVVSDNCIVTLRHNDSLRTLRFDPHLTTDIKTGTVGLDTALGRQLQSAELMSIVSLPTPLGEKTYQIVAISPAQVSHPGAPKTDATVRNNDRHTTGV